MEPVRVPQHLDLQDVVAWGLGAVDLLCIVVALTAGWWLYLTLPGEPLMRAAAAVPLALVGLACGVVRVGEVALRDWLVVAAAYALRPRVLLVD